MSQEAEGAVGRPTNIKEEKRPDSQSTDCLPDDPLAPGSGAERNRLEGQVPRKACSRQDGDNGSVFDAWFIGYTAGTRDRSVVGFDGERWRGENETGSQAASPIWVSFMSKALKDRPVKDFPVPEGIEFMRVEPKTGQPSSRRGALLECFREGTAPSSKFIVQSKAPTDFFKFDFNSSARPPSGHNSAAYQIKSEIEINPFGIGFICP